MSFTCEIIITTLPVRMAPDQKGDRLWKCGGPGNIHNVEVVVIWKRLRFYLRRVDKCAICICCCTAQGLAKEEAENDEEKGRRRKETELVHASFFLLIWRTNVCRKDEWENCFRSTVDLGYNDTGCNDNLVKAMRCHGINYFLREITITSLFRLSLRFQKNFDSFVRESL